MGESGGEGGSAPLSRLVEVARGLSGLLDLDRLLPAILDGVIALAGAERGAVLLRNDEGELTVRAVRDGEGADLDPRSFSLSESVVAEATASEQTMLIDDAAEMDLYRSRQSILSLNLRTILCAPLLGADGVLGLLYVDSHLVSRRFTPEDRELTEAFAAVATVALESTRLHEVSLERDRMALELNLAARIQRSFLPPRFPEIPGFSGAARTEPAGQVGGDFYDFVPLPDGRHALFVVDVSGKGVPAALAMARLASHIRARAARSSDLGDLLTMLNENILRRGDGQGFVTLVVAVVDPDSGEVELYRCGHPQPLLVERGRVHKVSVDGTPPIGIQEEIDPRPHRLVLSPGNLVLLYTDGALDARDVTGELFGSERLRDAVEKAEGGPREVIASVVRFVDGFSFGGRRTDDLTLVSFGRTES